MALDDTMDTQPTKAATPITSDQKPTSSSAQTTIHTAMANWIHSPARNIRNAPTRRTNRLFEHGHQKQKNDVQRKIVAKVLRRDVVYIDVDKGTGAKEREHAREAKAARQHIAQYPLVAEQSGQSYPAWCADGTADAFQPAAFRG